MIPFLSLILFLLFLPIFFTCLQCSPSSPSVSFAHFFHLFIFIHSYTHPLYFPFLSSSLALPPCIPFLFSCLCSSLSHRFFLFLPIFCLLCTSSLLHPFSSPISSFSLVCSHVISIFITLPRLFLFFYFLASSHPFLLPTIKPFPPANVSFPMIKQRPSHGYHTPPYHPHFNFHAIIVEDNILKGSG